MLFFMDAAFSSAAAAARFSSSSASPDATARSSSAMSMLWSCNHSAFCSSHARAASTSSLVLFMAFFTRWAGKPSSSSTLCCISFHNRFGYREVGTLSAFRSSSP